MPKLAQRSLKDRPFAYVDDSPSLTKQSFKEECDVKFIVDRYKKTGNWGSGLSDPTKQPMYGDFSSVPQYQESLNLAIEADNFFMSMPSDIRDRFANDTQKFLAFINDENNLEEAITIGILQRNPASIKQPVSPPPNDNSPAVLPVSASPAKKAPVSPVKGSKDDLAPLPGQQTIE